MDCTVQLILAFTTIGGRSSDDNRAGCAQKCRVASVKAYPGTRLAGWLTTTDHKRIGALYLITSFSFFLLAGVLALIIRAELAKPGLQIVNEEVYNQLFTVHGTIMLLLFATPLFVGFANVIMPIQIGAPDVAFPRLNMFIYWPYLFGALITIGGFATQVVRRTGDGPATRHCPMPPVHRASVGICGSSACGCQAWARSSARSTSSRPSSRYALPV
jgi:hypothetical protein